MGMLYRGAIVIGELHHRKSIVFGKGLIEACRLESKIARYPRIILSHAAMLCLKDAAVKFFNDSNGRYLEEIIAQADDKIPFINVLSSEFGWDRTAETALSEWTSDTITPVIAMLDMKLEELADEKEYEISPLYLWMLSYANNIRREIEDRIQQAMIDKYEKMADLYDD